MKLERKIEAFFDEINASAKSTKEYIDALELIDSECDARLMAIEDEDEE